MKTRKLAAKALSVAVVATTVSGYAMAGDHSITADPSFTPWCTKTHKLEVTSGTGATTNDVCGTAADFEVNASGKLGGGWGYAFQIQDVDETGYPTALKGTVYISKDLGNNLTLGMGDTGDASRESHGATWNMNDDVSLNGEGGVKISYSKGAINADVVYGGQSAASFGANTSISVGADYTMGGLKAGFSYATNSWNTDVKKNAAVTKADSTGMGFGLSYTMSNFVASFDYVSQTEKECPAADCGVATTGDLKTTEMGINANMTSGVFRAGIGYSSIKSDGRGTAANEVEDTVMNVGLRYHPAAWTNSHARFTYTSVSNKDGGTEDEDASYSQMSLSVHTSVSML